MVDQASKSEESHAGIDSTLPIAIPAPGHVSAESAPSKVLPPTAPPDSKAPSRISSSPAPSGQDIFTLLSSEETRRNPYPVYARLRKEQPILDTGAGIWFLFGYEECNRLLRNSELSVDERNALIPGPGDKLPTLIHLDPPDHGRLRKLVQLAFTPKRVEALRGRVQELVRECLDTWKPGDTVDVIAELAYPVPLTIICELLGIAEDRCGLVQEWSAWMAQSIDPGALRSPELNAQIAKAQSEFVEEIRTRIIYRRANPGDDLLSQLVLAESDGDRLSESELFGLAVLLLVAGHETTVSLIGNSLHALLVNPSQLFAFREAVATTEFASTEVTRRFIDEMLRFDSPVQMTTRIATQPIELNEHTIPKGHIIVLMLGAANHDPKIFENPEQLNVSLERASSHLSFGAGIHHCLGAMLARTEGEIAVVELFRRFPNVALVGEPELRPTFVLRGRQELVVRL
jgi:cytochrome P450